MDFVILNNEWFICKGDDHNDRQQIIFPTKSAIHQILERDNGDCLLLFWNGKKRPEICEMYYVDMCEGKIRWQVRAPEGYKRQYVKLVDCGGRVYVQDYDGHTFLLNEQSGHVTPTTTVPAASAETSRVNVRIFQNKWYIGDRQKPIRFPGKNPLHQLVTLDNGDWLLLFYDPGRGKLDMCAVYCVDVAKNRIRWKIQKPKEDELPFKQYGRGSYVHISYDPDASVIVHDFQCREFYLNLEDGSVRYTGYTGK